MHKHAGFFLVLNMDGELINLYVYDAGTRLPLEQVKSLFRNPEDFSKYEYNTPTPEEIPTFTMPQVFNLKSGEFQVDGKSIGAKVQVAIYELGVFSIRIRIPLEGIDESMLSKLAFGKEAAQGSEQLALRAKQRVEVALSKQFRIKFDEYMENYTFYFINGTKAQAMKSNRNLIAGLLVDERDVAELDPAYVDDVLSRNISYNYDDAFFVGWEGAVLIDKLKSYDYELLMAEIANMQLLKLRIYRRKAAELLSSTSKDVGELENMGLLKRTFSSKASKLNNRLNIFADELAEEMNRIDNTVFGLGEWYLSKLYSLFASAFKLQQLREAVAQAASSIAARKELVSEAINAKRNDFLEFVIILLIVIEILVEVAYLAR